MNTNKNHILIFTLILIMGLVLVGCASAGEIPGESLVFMQSNAFQPEELSISAGTTVTWTNEDLDEHTVTAGTRESPSGLFDETVPPGGVFSFTFEEPGTYEYFCRIQTGMDGTVIVE